MAATKLQLNTQPNTTTQGYSIIAGSSTITGPRSIEVALVDASGNVDTTNTTPVTVTIGTNPGGGTLQGTLSATPVNGVAVFRGLNITAGGAGYTLSFACSGLTGIVSNPFTIIPVNRIDPANLRGLITSAVFGAAGNTVGPYRFRAGTNLGDIEISFFSTVSGDTATVAAVEPGVTLTSSNSATLTSLTANEVTHLAGNGLGGDMDVYVFGTAVTGSATVSMRGIRTPARV